MRETIINFSAKNFTSSKAEAPQGVARGGQSPSEQNSGDPTGQPCKIVLLLLLFFSIIPIFVFY